MLKPIFSTNLSNLSRLDRQFGAATNNVFTKGAVTNSIFTKGAATNNVFTKGSKLFFGGDCKVFKLSS